MKLTWRALKVVFGVGGFALTYGSLGAVKAQADKWGLDWIWYAVIGVTILLIALGTVIVQLYLENRYLKSEDKKLEREKKKLEIQDLQWRRLSRGI